MGYMIIQKKDKKKMASMCEEILYTAGELMHCIEKMEEEEYGERYGNRDGMGMRDGGSYGNRYGSRLEDPNDMGERRNYRRY